MTFTRHSYPGLVCEQSQAQQRLFRHYRGAGNAFDVVVVGSGMGGGVLADDLVERLGARKRILVVEAGSFLFPTHVYNVSRFSNSDLARRFGCRTFAQPAGDSGAYHHIGEELQLNLGGRSLFWSGLIPRIQPWELQFFPERVRQELQEAGWLARAGDLMNESRTMGDTARDVVQRLRASPLSEDFDIRQTPRALHQPYLNEDGSPANSFFTEPTGVFNTAELLINQIGQPSAHPQQDDQGPGLHLLLNHYVEDLQRQGSAYRLLARSTLDEQVRWIEAPVVVLAGGSIGSAKLLRRSTLFRDLDADVQRLVGRGLTDHPTTHTVNAFARAIGGVPLTGDAHAKIIFYSRGRRGAQQQVLFPFNVEMNINHEYWHVRDDDPSENAPPPRDRPARIDLKFSFGNCLQDENEIRAAPPYGYLPEIAFRNLSWAAHLAHERFPALAGWNKSTAQVWDTLNDTARAIFLQFDTHGVAARAEHDAKYGQNGLGFGWGTVHHAVGTLRMPWRPSLDAPWAATSVVDEDLQLRGADNLHVCDMSVLPFSSAANPVRTLVALALRLSRRLG
ncbi:MAG TPA: GMC oxidoreductase [Ramlibacter sp.]|jgi:hypothetical protein|nr:GMC oxidoreductase [Ramlibacter sp.]